MATDLQPYSYKVYKPDYFSFTTDSGAEYLLLFSYAEYFSDYLKLLPAFLLLILILFQNLHPTKGVDRG